MGRTYFSVRAIAIICRVSHAQQTEEGHGRRSTTTDLHRFTGSPRNVPFHYRHPMSTTSVQYIVRQWRSLRSLRTVPPSIRDPWARIPLAEIIPFHNPQRQCHGPNFLDIPFGLPPPALSPYPNLYPGAVGDSSIRSFVPFAVCPPIARWTRMPSSSAMGFGLGSPRAFFSFASCPLFWAHFWNFRSRAAALFFLREYIF
ncbi:hypothetical protein BC826DRAFT_105315 [Russula brevipes]|nr:hypothetical protein BC826DRAFT_105315 [Russula brevipes]